MGRLLKRFPVRCLALMGLSSSMFAYLLFGAATEGWMLFAVIVANGVGATVQASIQSIISSAADARNQGQALGAVTRCSLSDRSEWTAAGPRYWGLGR